MADKLKFNFEIDYKKSDLEKGLESTMKNYSEKGMSAPDPELCMEDEESNISRQAIIDKDLTINYQRDFALYNLINYGQAPSTTEYIFLNFKNEGNMYAFKLDCNEKFLDDYDGDSVNSIAPNYKGLLDDKHVFDKRGYCITPKMTKERFLTELNKILKEYKGDKKWYLSQN